MQWQNNKNEYMSRRLAESAMNQNVNTQKARRKTGPELQKKESISILILAMDSTICQSYCTAYF